MYPLRSGLNESRNIFQFKRFALAEACVSSLIILTMMSSFLHASEIRSDEWVVFFPTPAHFSGEDDQWIVGVHGWIFEPEEDSLLRAAALSRVRSALELSVDESSGEIFDQRAHWLLVDNERGKRLTIRVGNRSFPLDPSTPDGHFFGEFRLTASHVKRLVKNGRVQYAALTNADDSRTFAGEIHLIEAQGLSVISDIDDTIKVTEVGSKRKLIKNTFLRPFRAVEGMAGLYRHWEDAGARFHFVSASPWQLYVPLAKMASDAGFPAATYHLKRVRLKDKRVLQLFSNPLDLKLKLIEGIMANYPERRFILVGDSGERDPDVYGAIARKYPNQVHRIYIRDVTGQPRNAEKYQQAFADVPRAAWQLFREPEELPTEP